MLNLPYLAITSWGGSCNVFTLIFWRVKSWSVVQLLWNLLESLSIFSCHLWLKNLSGIFGTRALYAFIASSKRRTEIAVWAMFFDLFFVVYFGVMYQMETCDSFSGRCILLFSNLHPAWNVCSLFFVAIFQWTPKTAQHNQAPDLRTWKSRKVLVTATEEPENRPHRAQWRLEVQAFESRLLDLLQRTPEENKGKAASGHGAPRTVPARPIWHTQPTAYSWGKQNEDGQTEGCWGSASHHRSWLAPLRLRYQQPLPGFQASQR